MKEDLQDKACIYLEEEVEVQHTATHCNTLQHTATHGITRQHKAILCSARCLMLDIEEKDERADDGARWREGYRVASRRRMPYL